MRGAESVSQKTYSLCFYQLWQGELDWFVNWAQNYSLDDFDWDKIKENFDSDENVKKVAYQYCINSNQYHPRVKKHVVYER